MASVPDQSGANQVQFDYKAASSLVDDILAVPATASAVMNEVSDGSTAPVPPAQSPAGMWASWVWKLLCERVWVCVRWEDVSVRCVCMCVRVWSRAWMAPVCVLVCV